MKLCIPEHYLLFRQEDLIGCMLLAIGACLHVSIKLKSGESSLCAFPEEWASRVAIKSQNCFPGVRMKIQFVLVYSNCF